MDFSKLRHRIVFLKPLDSKTNSMGETVPVWVPFKPCFNNNLNITEKDEVYITSDYRGNAVFKNVDGTPYAHKLDLHEFEVWANVAPSTGREYEEAQKLLGETTYNIDTRYFPGIDYTMKILFRNRVMDIISVLNINERNTALRIVAKERDNYGTEY